MTDEGAALGRSSRAAAAVVFDFYGTLVPGASERVWRQQAEAMSRHLGTSVAAIHDALAATFPARLVGELGDLESTVAALAAGLGLVVTPEQVRCAADARRSMHRRLLVPRDDAVSTLAALKDAGLRTGLISDCTAELPEEWNRLTLSRFVDAAVFSCVERRRKPDRGLFEASLARIGAPAHRTLYVADGVGEELLVAESVGMRAFQLQVPDDEVDWRYPPNQEWTGGRLSRLTDVLDVVGLS